MILCEPKPRISQTSRSTRFSRNICDDRNDNKVWRVVAPLRPGVTIEQAQAQLNVRAEQVEKEFANRAGTGWKLTRCAVGF